MGQVRLRHRQSLGPRLVWHCRPCRGQEGLTQHRRHPDQTAHTDQVARLDLVAHTDLASHTDQTSHSEQAVHSNQACSSLHRRPRLVILSRSICRDVRCVCQHTRTSIPCRYSSARVRGACGSALAPRYPVGMVLQGCEVRVQVWCGCTHASVSCQQIPCCRGVRGFLPERRADSESPREPERARGCRYRKSAQRKKEDSPKEALSRIHMSAFMLQAR